MLIAIASAVRDREEREREWQQRWGVTEELLARIAELVHQLTMVTVDMHGKWAGGRPDPLHITRPGEKPRNVMSLGDMARKMAGR